MRKIPVLLSLTTILIMFITVYPSRGQSDEQLTLSLGRNFGYSSGTGKIQGTFTMKVTAPEGIEYVIFQIDGEEIGSRETPPFELRFQTDDYPLGIHTLTAIGFSQDGGEVSSNQVQIEFVSAETGWRSVTSILFPLFGIIFAGILLSYIIPNLFRRRSKGELPLGAPRSYGLLGGAICPKCARPFSRHIWGLNLGVGKYDRCPHCGKWSLVRRALSEDLRVAELNELEMINTRMPQTPSEEEILRKELDDTRYDDL